MPRLTESEVLGTHIPTDQLTISTSSTRRFSARPAGVERHNPSQHVAVGRTRRDIANITIAIGQPATIPRTAREQLRAVDKEQSSITARQLAAAAGVENFQVALLKGLQVAAFDTQRRG